MKVKNKLIYTAIVILLAVAYYWYYSWNEAQKEALKWIEDHGIQTEVSSNSLAEKLPDNLKFLEKYFGKNLRSLDLSPGNRTLDFDPIEALDYPIEEKKLEPIRDISILKRFPSLKELSLESTAVTNISVLKYLKDLEKLDLSGTTISDFSILKELKNLESLYLSNMEIKDLRVLSHLKNLKTLYLSNSTISDITALKDLKSLENLYLSQAVFNGLPKLGNLTNLKYINFRNTQFSDFSALKTLPAIEELNLALSDVSDLGALFKLNTLNEIDLRVTPVSSKQVKELQTQLPACRIRHRDYGDKYVADYLRRTVPRLKFSDTSLNSFFRVVSEESITNDPEYIGPLIYRSREFGVNETQNFMSLDLEELTMGEIIQLVCKYKGLHYKIEKHAVIVYHPSALTKADRARGTMNLGEKEIPLRTQKSKVEKQLKEIIIPKVRFEDRDADFIVDFIKRTSRDLSEDQTGINILSMIKADLKINLDRDNISVKEVLENICEQLNVKYYLEANTVILEPKKN